MMVKDVNDARSCFAHSVEEKEPCRGYNRHSYHSCDLRSKVQALSPQSSPDRSLTMPLSIVHLEAPVCSALIRASSSCRIRASRRCAAPW